MGPAATGTPVAGRQTGLEIPCALPLADPRQAHSEPGHFPGRLLQAPPPAAIRPELLEQARRFVLHRR